jgi:hypothetical protein
VPDALVARLFHHLVYQQLLRARVEVGGREGEREERGDNE